MSSKPYCILVPPAVREALQQRAAQEGVTVAALVRTAIERYLAELPPLEEQPPPSGGDVDINVRLSEEAEAALERHMLAAHAPRHTPNAVARLALAKKLGVPLCEPMHGELTIISTRLPPTTAERLRAAAAAYSREALIRNALAAYRKQRQQQA
jgi:predicted DNA-binding protein